MTIMLFRAGKYFGGKKDEIASKFRLAQRHFVIKQMNNVSNFLALRLLEEQGLPCANKRVPDGTEPVEHSEGPDPAKC